MWSNVKQALLYPKSLLIKDETRVPGKLITTLHWLLLSAYIWAPIVAVLTATCDEITYSIGLTTDLENCQNGDMSYSETIQGLTAPYIDYFTYLDLDPTSPTRNTILFVDQTANYTAQGKYHEDGSKMVAEIEDTIPGDQVDDCLRMNPKQSANRFAIGVKFDVSEDSVHTSSSVNIGPLNPPPQTLVDYTIAFDLTFCNIDPGSDDVGANEMAVPVMGASKFRINRSIQSFINIKADGTNESINPNTDLVISLLDSIIDLQSSFNLSTIPLSQAAKNSFHQCKNCPSATTIVGSTLGIITTLVSGFFVLCLALAETKLYRKNPNPYLVRSNLIAESEKLEVQLHLKEGATSQTGNHLDHDTKPVSPVALQVIQSESESAAALTGTVITVAPASTSAATAQEDRNVTENLWME